MKKSNRKIIYFCCFFFFLISFSFYGQKKTSALLKNSWSVKSFTLNDTLQKIDWTIIFRLDGKFGLCSLEELDPMTFLDEGAVENIFDGSWRMYLKKFTIIPNKNEKLEFKILNENNSAMTIEMFKDKKKIVF